eukprot:55017-Amphidinium_carterae.4
MRVYGTIASGCSVAVHLMHMWVLKRFHGGRSYASLKCLGCFAKPQLMAPPSTCQKGRLSVVDAAELLQLWILRLAQDQTSRRSTGHEGEIAVVVGAHPFFKQIAVRSCVLFFVYSLGQMCDLVKPNVRPCVAQSRTARHRQRLRRTAILRSKRDTGILLKALKM